MKASVVVKNTKLTEMAQAFKKARVDPKKHLKKEVDDDSDIDYLKPT